MESSRMRGKGKGPGALLLGLGIGLISGEVEARGQGLPPRGQARSALGAPELPPLPPPPPPSRLLPAKVDPFLMRTQAVVPDPAQVPGELPQLPEATTPGVDPSILRPAPNVPDPTTTDLALPAAERDFTGGEATEVAEAAEEPEDTRGLLMKALDFDVDSPFKVYGWIQNSFTGNPSFPSDGFNFGVNPNYLSNQWMGNQYYTVFEKTMKREGEFDWGARFDFLFGNDWQFNKMRGVFDNAFVPNRFAGIDLPQFYGEFHLPVLTEGGLDVKFGRWYTLHGYEVVPAIARPLLSVPYMFNYGQPFTHWGVMTTWNVSDQLLIYNGIPQGWDRFQNEHARWGYMGGLSWTSKNGKFNFTHIYSHNTNQFTRFNILVQNGIPGPVANANATDGSIDLWTTVVSYKWTDKLTQVIETDQGIENGVPVYGLPKVLRNNGEWYSFGNWFLYQFAEKWTGVWRSEVFRDDDGIRTGTADTFYEQTLGLIYKPKDWLWIRPEARYDWAQFKHPYNGGVSSSQFTLGFDVILLY